jgi:hypothetical protein
MHPYTCSLMRSKSWKKNDADRSLTQIAGHLHFTSGLERTEKVDDFGLVSLPPFIWCVALPAYADHKSFPFQAAFGSNGISAGTDRHPDVNHVVFETVLKVLVFESEDFAERETSTSGLTVRRSSGRLVFIGYRRRESSRSSRRAPWSFS